MILTVDELREHVETALGDDALERILNAAEGDMNQHGGILTTTLDVPDAVTEYFYPTARTLWFTAANYIDEIVEVTENDVILDPLMYEVRNGREIYRLDNLYWGSPVIVEYVPTTEELNRRKMLLVNLAKLYINADPGTSFQGAATWQTTVTDFEEQKQRLLWAWKRPPVLA